MTAPTDEFVQIAQHSQKAVTAAVRTWGEKVQNATGTITAENPLPGPAQTVAVVDAWFDVAAQVLADQRAATTALVARTHEAVTAFTEQAWAVTGTLTEKVVGAAGAASESLAKARAPRNGAGNGAAGTG